MNGAAFLTYVERVLVRTLTPGHIVVMATCHPTNCLTSAKPSKWLGRR